jgi:glutathione S-transferase
LYTLYHAPVSGNSYKVLLLLEQLGVPYEVVELDILGGAARTETFAQLNPKRRVPVLVTAEGQVLTESNAILWYLARGSQFVPKDEFAQAQVLEWMFFEQNHLESNLGLPRLWDRLLRIGEEKAAAIAERRAAAQPFLKILDAHLAGHRFLVADSYSIADICLYAYTHNCHEGGFDLTPYPAIRAWLERITLQPRFVAMPPAWHRGIMHRTG